MAELRACRNARTNLQQPRWFFVNLPHGGGQQRKAVRSDASTHVAAPHRAG
jgi:hypothetical protein